MHTHSLSIKASLAPSVCRAVAHGLFPSAEPLCQSPSCTRWVWERSTVQVGAMETEGDGAKTRKGRGRGWMERRRRARVGKRQSNVRNGTQSNAIQSKRKKGRRRRMKRCILGTFHFSSDRNESHVQLVLGWILRLDCLGSSLTSSHADRSILVLVHADQPPSDSCSVASHGPLAMPLPPPEKGRDAGRGPTRKAGASTVGENRGKQKKDEKK